MNGDANGAGRASFGLARRVITSWALLGGVVLMGIALIALADAMSAWLGLPIALLRWAGVLLLPCAALMLIAGRYTSAPRVLVLLIVAGNLAWVAASAYVAVAIADITPFGQIFVIVQALIVLGLAVLEWRGLASPGDQGNLHAA